MLVGLGKAPDVSLAFLMSAQVEAFDAVKFRKHSGASARDRTRTEAVVMDRLERYPAIEHILDIEAGVARVERRRCDSVASESRIDERADALLGVRDLGRDPIPGPCELLEDKGIKVVEADRRASTGSRATFCAAARSSPRPSWRPAGYQCRR